VYKSSTLILVEQPTMPKNYVESNVSGDLQDRLQSITQQMLSRTRLLLIIDKFNLYGGMGSQNTADEKVERMRKDVSIELVRDNRGDQITAFRTSYSANDPHLAQQVTTELTDLFITDNLKVRQQESEGTTQFLESQLDNAQANLAKQEEKVREFEGQHGSSLPTQQASNLQILSGLQAQLQNEQDALNTAKQQRVYLQSLMEQYRGFRGPTVNANGTPTSLSVIEQELATLRAKLADLSSHYTDRYPDVLNLKEQIARTEKTRDELIAEQKSRASGAQSGEAASDHTSAESSDSAPAMQLQSQLQANEVEIKNREQSIAGLNIRIGGYQARLNEQPAVEQQLAEIQRGYDQSKANYDDLLKKKNESQMATRMEQAQQGERFGILDPPSLPTKPDSPNRLKMCGIGLGVGVVLGLLVVIAFEFMDDRLYSEKEIKNLLPVAIISEIPEVVSLSDEESRKKGMVFGWSMAALVVVIILAGSAVSYLHG